MTSSVILKPLGYKSVGSRHLRENGQFVGTLSNTRCDISYGLYKHAKSVFLFDIYL